MAAKTLLAPATGAGNSAEFVVGEQHEATVYLHATSGLVVSEFADLQISHDGGSTWADYFKDGSQVRLTNTNNAVTIYGPGRFRVAKDATTNAAGIYLFDDLNL